MATVTKVCEQCNKEYEGHHRSKYCPECKASDVISLGSDIVVEDAVLEVPDDYERFAVIPGCFGYTGKRPKWADYGMCEGGYEVFPGWVWSQKKLVCVRGDAPKEVLEMMQDAFQRRVVNRVPVLGDADCGKAGSGNG